MKKTEQDYKIVKAALAIFKDQERLKKVLMLIKQKQREQTNITININIQENHYGKED